MSNTKQSKFITPAVIAAWREYYDFYPGESRKAYISMQHDYNSGKEIGGVSWRTVWRESPDLCGIRMPATIPPGMPLPAGWSFKNLLRHKPDKSKPAAALDSHKAIVEQHHDALRKKVLENPSI